MVNSLYVATLSSGDDMPTCASYTRALRGFFGLGCLKTYFSSWGGFQNLASYAGDTERSCVTYLIQAGRRSTLLPSGSTSEILWAWSARRTLSEVCWGTSDLDLGIVGDCDLTLVVGSNRDLENPEGILLHGMRVTVPTVYALLARGDVGQARGCSALTEISNEESLLSVGSPLSIDNIVILINIQTECISSLGQCSQ